MKVCELKNLIFPECGKECELMHYLGVGECESVCPEKFFSNGEPKTHLPTNKGVSFEEQNDSRL
jgi:hypothetical protein